MLVATSLGLLGASLSAPLAEASLVAPPLVRLTLTQSEPSQVGETDADPETLDEGLPPASASDDDIEPLDAGAPPDTLQTSPVPVDTGVMVTEPTPPETAYTEPAGPRLPPGFGEGRVLVSNSPRGIPVGLEPCEVGVVTGRAYVGITCGEDGAPVVGHATFDEFPWVIDPGFPFEPGARVVTDPSFPFDEDSPFYESAMDRTADSDVVVLVAPRGFPFGDETDAESDDSAPRVVRGGEVALAQEAGRGKEERRRNRESTRVSGSASSGEVSSNPGKSRTRRSAMKKQRAVVGSESKRDRANAKQGNQAKAKKNKGKNKGKNKNKNKKNRKQANKETRQQRQAEKREQRNQGK